jgi:uncharacterized tellurite resistance protein B-like protein
VNLRTIQEFFEGAIRGAASEGEGEASEKALRLATAALLIELTRADFEVKDEERRAVEEGVRRTFGLTEAETAELIGMAEEQVRRAVSIYEFTHLIDQGFSEEQKKRLVELLWRVALSDSRIEAHEEQLIRKAASLIHVRHKDFIDAKIRARRALGGEAGPPPDRS